MVDREGEESTVGVRSHAGGSSALGEQTDLCVTGERQGQQESERTVADVEIAEEH